jgi:[protein-PII] uridylyltransferase
MINRITRHAKTRLNFDGDIKKAKRLSACKQFMKLEMQMVVMKHKQGESGIKVANARATIIDVMLDQLFTYALDHYENEFDELPVPVALVAVGGYGRAELSPGSDIDLMILLPARVKSNKIKHLQQFLTDEVLYILWDLGLKVGHSTRTIDDVFEEARREIKTKTALLESRFVSGSTSLYATYEQAYRNYYINEAPQRYIQARLQDQAARRARNGNTVFLQEPEIKSGVGGLRDYQNILWMARVKLGTTKLKELSDLNYLRKNELREFKKGYDFLLRVRNTLHFLSKRATDLLDLAKQPKVAYQMGFTSRNYLVRVEKFMREYYKNAQNIYQISKILEHRLALAANNESNSQISLKDLLKLRRLEKAKKIDGFILRQGKLAYENRRVFVEDPNRLIRVFRHQQVLNSTFDFELNSLIRESLPLITNQVIRSPEACQSFRSILGTHGQVYPTLQLMHELGVLGKFIPEWENLTCLVQHEFYHRYTADIHTLTTIRELDNVFSNQDRLYENYRDALRDTNKPSLLYLILLLHDIGKADGIKDHSLAGVKIAEPILERLQIPENNRATVRYVIKNHLEMARFMQKYDLDDPDTAKAFSAQVENVDNLRYLYVHTFCDARGTASSLWNSYKDTLHTTLFRNTVRALTSDKALNEQIAITFEETKKNLRKMEIPEVAQEEIEAHIQLLPNRYFTQTEPEEIALHVQMVNSLFKNISAADSMGTLSPVIDWKDDINRGITTVNIVTWDRSGLFYKLAGAFSLVGLTILSAKAVSRQDHIVIDTFDIIEPGRGIVQNADIMEKFQTSINQALVEQKDLYPEIMHITKSLEQNLLSSPTNPFHSTFPAAVHIYREETLDRTIVEIEAPDHIGLLYSIGKTLFEREFNITFARINTAGGAAIDTFHIENAVENEPVPPLDSPGMIELKEVLLKIVTPSKSEPV